MTHNIIEYCLKKNGATKDYPFGFDPLVIKIAGKMFALIFENKGNSAYINLKCDPVIAGNLREQHESVHYIPHEQKHWNTIVLDGSLPESDIYLMIDHSYDRVVQNLPKSLRQTIY